MEEDTRTGLCAEDVITRATATLILKFPFFGILACWLTKVPTDKVKTMAVTALGTMYYNPKFVDQLHFNDVVFIVAHEVMHLVQRSFARFPKGGNVQVWNIAADRIINVALEETKLPVGPEAASAITDEVRESVEKYKITETMYQFLMKEYAKEIKCKACKEEFEKQKMDDGEGSDGDGESEDSEGNESEGCGESGEGGHKHTCGMLDESGCGCDTGQLTEARAADEEGKWRDRIISAASAAEAKQGHVPDSVKQMIAELVTPSVRWQDKIKVLALKTFKGRYTYLRKSRRSYALGLRLPGKEMEQKGCVVGIDTSGSITEIEIVQFLSEVAGIMESCNCPEVYVMLHDSRVYYGALLKKSDLTTLEIARGGTSHLECFKVLEGEHNEWQIPFKPGMAIFFTDMMSTFPETTPCPVLWGVPERYEECEVPFGTKVIVTTKEEI